jgi:hypothetical protein
MHDNRRYVESRHDGYVFVVKALLPLVAAALVFPATARPELVVPGVDAGALAVARDGTPRVAWLDGRRLFIATRAETWRAGAVATLPGEGRIAGLTESVVLVEGRRTWIRLVVRRGSTWRVVKVADAPKRALLGVSGLVLDARGRPFVAYAIQHEDETTSLQLARLGTNGRITTTRVTRNGFPPSVLPPAAAPVLWPNGTIRVVESFSQRGANAILWRREGARWWGQVLHASSLGAAVLPLYAASTPEGFYLLWTIPYLTFGENHLVLSTRIDRSRSAVLHRNALAAALVLGQNGPEFAANEPFQGLFAGLLLGAVTTELDGLIVGYAATPTGGRQVLLRTLAGLEWFELPAPPTIRIVNDAAGWRVEGATGGTVTVYEETAGARHAVFEATVGPDGAFTFSLPVVPGGNYRLVYVDAATGVPYGRLLRPGS